MALFDKIFLGVKATQPNSHEDNDIRQNGSSFSSEQVRIVLFRECDFRGRKLLFDSAATEKIPIEKAAPDQKFVEVNNGYGYLVVQKQNSDYPQLSEMIFGSVAMSFRGTYFKIHSLSSPPRLMFTQVFPSPHGRRKTTSSTSSYQSHLSTNSSFEHSMKLDDSGASSNFSTSDRLSDRSTASDTVLVCRRLQSSPLDVPGVASSFSKTSLVVDSGCANQSTFSSFSTGPLTFPTWESVFSCKDLSTTSLSSCTALRRLLRSSTRSLQNSSVSLPNSTEVLKGTHRSSKLGLTVIVEISPEKEQFLTQLFMEHIALVEALIWRTRQAIEIAYHRPPTFISRMMDVAHNTATWLVNLLTAPRIVTNLWHCLFFDCDSSRNSINDKYFNSEKNRKSVTLCRTLRTKSIGNNSNNSDNNGDKVLGSSKSFSGLTFRERTDFFSFNFGKFLKTEPCTGGKGSYGEGELIVDKFLREFCQLLEELDVKETNFFISTLLTAVLTHHLGWVATVYPSSAVDEELICNFKQPYNALWDQLSDLYGATGHPVKTAQTIVTGNNKNNVIPKILNFLTYFIRFGNVERKNVERLGILNENKSAEKICMKNNCIPTEYYKRYEDHLKEMLTTPVESPKEGLGEDCKRVVKLCGTEETNDLPGLYQVKKTMGQSGLTKVKTHGNLSELEEDSEHSSKPSKDVGFHRVSSTLSDVLKNGSGNEESCFFAKTAKFIDCEKLETKTEAKKHSTFDINENVLENDCDKSDVVFVLGDNEKLVGLRKEDALGSTSDCVKSSSGMKRKISVVERPKFLNLSKNSVYNFPQSSTESRIIEPLKDVEGCTKCLMQSSSFDTLCPAEEESVQLEARINSRAQSEPPQFRKVSPPKLHHSRVKFNLHQYPQVVRNYMKSKNIELEGLSLGEKAFDKFATVQHNIKLDFSGYETDLNDMEALQTPSNASELEFTSDMCEGVTGPKDSREAASTSLEQASTSREASESRRMVVVNIPMPKTCITDNPEYSLPYTSTIMKGLVDSFIPDMVLQGTTNSHNSWHSKLKSNLAMNTRHSLLDQPVEESVAIVANTDTWEVQVMSSHTYVIDKGANGVRVGMSQLVASMLESLLQMWKLHIPPQHCITHIEQRLQELCVRSKSLAQMLLASEFCSMELLTSTLRIDVNDVPLLMAVASTHTPEVTRKYGLSFQ